MPRHHFGKSFEELQRLVISRKRSFVYRQFSFHAASNWYCRKQKRRHLALRISHSVYFIVTCTSLSICIHTHILTCSRTKVHWKQDWVDCVSQYATSYQFFVTQYSVSLFSPILMQENSLRFSFCVSSDSCFTQTLKYQLYYQNYLSVGLFVGVLLVCCGVRLFVCLFIYLFSIHTRTWTSSWNQTYHQNMV